MGMTPRDENAAALTDQTGVVPARVWHARRRPPSRDGEGCQPGPKPLPALLRVGRDPAESGRQRVDIPDGENLADAADEIRPAADGIADHGDQPAGHCLVNHQSPRLASARQREDVAARVPAWQLRLIDEPQAPHGQAGLVLAQFGPQRPVAEQQQVKLPFRSAGRH